MRQVSRISALLLILAAFVLQMSVVPYFRVFGAVPDLIIVPVIFFGLFFGSWSGIGAGIIAGILTDLLTLDFFGINTFILALVGFLAGVLSAKFSRDSRSAQFIAVSAFSILSSWIHYSIVRYFSSSPGFSFPEYMINTVFLRAAYTGIAAIFIFSHAIRWYGLRDLEELL